MNFLEYVDIYVEDNEAENLLELKRLEVCNELLEKISMYLNENDKKIFNYLFNENKEWVFNSQYRVNMAMKDISRGVFHTRSEKHYQYIRDCIDKINSLLICISCRKGMISFRFILQYTFYKDTLYMLNFLLDKYIVEIILRESMENYYKELLDLCPNKGYISFIFELYKSRVSNNLYGSGYKEYYYDKLLDDDGQKINKKFAEEVLRFIKSKECLIDDFEITENNVKVKFKPLTKSEKDYIKSIDISI